MIEIHGKYLVLLLQKSPVLGYLALPYLVTPSSPTVYALSERMTAAHVEAWHDKVSDELASLVKSSEKYSDHELFRRFCNKKKKETPSTFLKNTDPERIEKLIRPEVEKAVSEVLYKAMKLGVLVFMREDTRSVFLGDAIGFTDQHAETTMKFTRRNEGIDYQLSIFFSDAELMIREKFTEIITNYPAWVLFDGKLYFFKNDFDGNKVKPFLKRETILIPAKIEKEYFRKYIRKSVRGGNVVANGFDIRDLYPVPVPILSFEYNPFYRPSLSLSYEYGEKRILALRPGEVIVDLKIEDDEYFFLKIHRNSKTETGFYNSLKNIGLKEVAPGLWSVEDENYTTEEFLQWVNAHAEMFQEAGFTLENNHFEKQYYLGGIHLSADRTDAKDWFDLKMVVRLDNGTEIPFAHLKKNILSGEKEFTTSDGVTFIIPDAWFARYGDLCELGRFDGDKVRVKSSFFPVFRDLGWDVPDTAFTETEHEFYSVPESLKATLRTYQDDGYNWFRKLENAQLGGCLADDMGLGKTIQAIAYLLSQYDYSLETVAGSNNEDGSQLDLFGGDSESDHQPTLIAMPASLVHNWYLELQKFAPSLSVYRHTGISRTVNFNRFSHFHIILTTYGTLRNDLEQFKKLSFRNLILDESQMIKNPDSKTHKAVAAIRAENRFVLSGTPVENSLMDLWAQMNFVNPGMLGEREMFKRVFLKPITKGGNEEKLERLKKIIAPFVLRRTKKMVAKELPDKMEQTIYCAMPEEQKSVYDEEISKVRNELLEQIEEDEDPKVRFAVLQALTRLRQIACHPLLAGHEIMDSGKFNTVLQKVNTVIGEGHKVLMFSSFVEHLKLFATEFDDQGIAYEMLTGSTRNRQEVIDNFRESEEINVFLISLKAGGVGINLTEADYVFILDPWWNPAAENQAIDRAHRIGQEKNVFVYRFISKDTIEEKMLLLQEQKRTLAEEIIHTGENPIFKMSGEELENLLK